MSDDAERQDELAVDPDLWVMAVSRLPDNSVAIQVRPGVPFEFLFNSHAVLFAHVLKDAIEQEKKKRDVDPVEAAKGVLGQVTTSVLAHIRKEYDIEDDEGGGEHDLLSTV